MIADQSDEQDELEADKSDLLILVVLEKKEVRKKMQCTGKFEWRKIQEGVILDRN